MKLYHGGDHPPTDTDTGVMVHIDSRNGGEKHGMGTNADDFFHATTDGLTRNQIHIHAGGGDDTVVMDLGVAGSRSIQHGYHVFGDAGRDTFAFTNIGALRGTIVGRLDDFESTSDIILIDGQILNLQRPWEIKGADVDIVSYQGQQWIQIVNSAGGRALFALEGARQTKQPGGWSEEKHFLQWNHAIPSELPVVDFENPQNSLPEKILRQLLPANHASYNVIRQDGNSVEGTPSNDMIDTGRGDDLIRGGEGRDYISANIGADTIYGGSGGDIIEGGKGFDSIHGGAGNDVISGGSDADTIRGGTGNDLIYGGTENDLILGEDGNDRVYGGRGNDTILGGQGHDVLFGSGQNDRIAGGQGRDTILGGSGNDDLSGEGDSDVVYGGSGNDRLHGNVGNDKLDGGSGDDFIVGGEGNDWLIGGLGSDSLYGGPGDNRLNGGFGNDLLHVSSHKNLLIGGAGNDMLYGGAGDDTLFGNADRDTLRGGAGADVLDGGSGQDMLFGGAAADQFVFRHAENFVRGTFDTIADFSPAEGDKVDLSGMDADRFVAGNQAFDFIGRSAFTGEAGELRYEVYNNCIVVYGDLNGDGKSDFGIQINHVNAIGGDDFVL